MSETFYRVAGGYCLEPGAPLPDHTLLLARGGNRIRTRRAGWWRPGAATNRQEAERALLERIAMAGGNALVEAEWDGPRHSLSGVPALLAVPSGLGMELAETIVADFEPQTLPAEIRVLPPADDYEETHRAEAMIARSVIFFFMGLLALFVIGTVLTSVFGRG
ncbi:hypothetical protein [Sutterella sp.]|uniref:hypothetical protein n=1 Tax=Sutterella sp. TaxID=1981025 RepID=UPI0026E03296|nr:hypothetical protein [Sutterella sp.]MDO5532947.1 hypothetical protein [Sutterella sp.]